MHTQWEQSDIANKKEIIKSVYTFSNSIYRRRTFFFFFFFDLDTEKEFDFFFDIFFFIILE